MLARTMVTGLMICSGIWAVLGTAGGDDVENRLAKIEKRLDRLAKVQKWQESELLSIRAGGGEDPTAYATRLDLSQLRRRVDNNRKILTSVYIELNAVAPVYPGEFPY